MVGLEERFEGLHLHPELAFVVDGAAGIDVLVTFGGLEGRRNPFIERLGRLDVVVGIAEGGGLAFGVEPIAIDQWVALGLDDLDILEANAVEFVGDELGSLANVVPMFFFGADAGNAKEIFEFFEEPGLIVASVFDCCRGHERTLLDYDDGRDGRPVAKLVSIQGAARRR
jgi:hypothetical protein